MTALLRALLAALPQYSQPEIEAVLPGVLIGDPEIIPGAIRYEGEAIPWRVLLLDVGDACHHACKKIECPYYVPLSRTDREWHRVFSHETAQRAIRRQQAQTERFRAMFEWEYVEDLWEHQAEQVRELQAMVDHRDTVIYELLEYIGRCPLPDREA